LVPPKECVVPLWLALMLKRANQCTIIPPAWLTSTTLKSLLDQERSHKDQFQSLPSHFYTLSKSIFEYARDDLERVVGSAGEAHQLRHLVAQVRMERLVKLQMGVKDMNGVLVKVTGMTQVECQSVHGFMTRSMRQLAHFQ
jgi:GINS complex subunit 2